MSIDDVSAEPESTSGGFGRAVRSFLTWMLILAIAVAAGFAGGYVLRYKELRDLERDAAQERVEMAAEMAALEQRVVETENAQLEQALARANVVANLEEVLSLLPGALAEIEQFGQAMQDIDAAEQALTDADLSGTARDSLSGTLEGLRERLKALDLRARQRVAASAEGLEEAMAAEQHDMESDAVSASATEAEAAAEPETAGTEPPADSAPEATPEATEAPPAPPRPPSPPPHHFE